MVISYKYKFIFIHTPKCAGSSIKRALAPYGRINNKSPFTSIRKRLNIPNDAVSPYLSVFRTFTNHGKAVELQNEIPSKFWRSYFKFAFVRNPFDWVVSHYFYILKDKNHPHHSEVAKCKNFKEYVKKEYYEHLTSRPNPQTSFLYDSNNNLLVDFVGKYELLNKDFRKICNKIGINAELPHINKSTHVDYKNYYDRETIELVKAHCNMDLENFKYDS